MVDNVVLAKFEEEEDRLFVRTRTKERDVSATDDNLRCYGG